MKKAIFLPILAVGFAAAANISAQTNNESASQPGHPALLLRAPYAGMHTSGDYAVRVLMMRLEARLPRSMSSYTLRISVK